MDRRRTVRRTLSLFEAAGYSCSEARDAGYTAQEAMAIIDAWEAAAEAD